MRLTKKEENGGYVIQHDLSTYYLCHFHPKDVFDVFAKLGQLEDIEEELGIELSIVIKGAINGIWYNSNGTLYFERMDVSFSEKCFREYIDYCKNYNEFYFKDYGKTWALMKEELL